MDRALGSSPIVWLGIILTTCLLLAVFQTVLWLVVPVLLAVVSYYVLSPLVQMAMARGFTRSRAVMIVTLILCIFLVALGAIIYPKIIAASHGWRERVSEYVTSGSNLVLKAEKTLSSFFCPLSPHIRTRSPSHQRRHRRSGHRHNHRGPGCS